MLRLPRRQAAAPFEAEAWSRGEPPASIEVIASSAVGSPVVNYKVEALKNRDFTPAFTARQMAKDFDLALDTAKNNHIPMPITSSVRQHWSAMISTGRGDQDFFAYVEMLEDMAGLKK